MKSILHLIPESHAAQKSIGLMFNTCLITRFVQHHTSHRHVAVGSLHVFRVFTFHLHYTCSLHHVFSTARRDGDDERLEEGAIVFVIRFNS